jgi:hypothetical protein
VILQKSIIKIQAWWRKVLTLKKLQAETIKMRTSLSERTSMSSEHFAIREFTQQLKIKKLTPESFFRVCDTDYKQVVTVQSFK